MATLILFVDSLYFEWVHHQWNCNINCAYNGSKWIRKLCGISISLHHVRYADAHVQFLCKFSKTLFEETQNRVFFSKFKIKFKNHLLIFQILHRLTCHLLSPGGAWGAVKLNWCYHSVFSTTELEMFVEIFSTLFKRLFAYPKKVIPRVFLGNFTFPRCFPCRLHHEFWSSEGQIYLLKLYNWIICPS